MAKIGVTGHRFLADLETLTESVDDTLRIIEDHFESPYTVISSLAEGADRLIPYRAFARWEEARLVVSLPLLPEDYLKDFKTLSSKADFINLMQLAAEILQPPNAASRAAAYEQAGRRVMDLCDVLIALWDGGGAQGSGGTAEIVASARAKGLPLVWIHAGNRIPGTETAVSLGVEQGKITLENFEA